MSEAIPSATLLRHQGPNVPRYTSYPTAPHFSAAVGAESYRAWLARVPAGSALSLYVHIPFCRRLCWYCGCHTQVVRRAAPVERYLDALAAEMRTVAALLPDSVRASHLHWGGGTPSLLDAAQIGRLAAAQRRAFAMAPEAEFAVEIDPRGFDAARAAALAEAGVNRVSIGVQDLTPEVQRAIDRVQSLELTREVVQMLCRVGIVDINLDLMYGLPHQSVAAVLATVEAVLPLAPARFALFGYAHVPWMKRHQRLIDEAALPAPAERLEALRAATARLERAGYVAIGLDHFARPDDSLARARAAGRLHRNFQGYTVDSADVLLGFGASAIGRLAEGYVQNEVAIPGYVKAVGAGGLATRRGVGLAGEDRLRREIIERLMCDLGVDLAAVGARHGVDAAAFAPELAALADYAAEGLVRLDGATIEVAEQARPLLRSVAAIFDPYLSAGPGRHAQAV